MAIKRVHVILQMANLSSEAHAKYLGPRQLEFSRAQTSRALQPWYNSVEVAEVLGNPFSFTSLAGAGPGFYC